MNTVCELNNYKSYIENAIIKLRINEVEESHQLILNALSLNPDAPEPHNLLGIWNELNGNNELARKHYRASYSLDPTYKPASNNLERLCTYYALHRLALDFGEESI